MSATATTADSRLRIEDLIFSRTDDRGVIQSGNDVFQQVSLYSWDRLVGAPHKIIRHGDMPKGVFYMLWETIKAGEPMGAYVQNLAEDGTSYWVFSTVLPLEDGYISLRLKPSGKYFTQIIPVYETVRAAERAGQLTPQQSAEKIVEAVRSLGFADYPEFMSFALRDEAWSRDGLLHRSRGAIRDNLAEMFRDIREMEQRAIKVEETFRKTHQIPYNMRLQAGRLEGSDGPISVISSNHRQMTQSLEENLERFTTDSSVGADAIRMALFRTSVAILLEEVAQAYETESDHGHWDKARQLAELRGLALRYRDQSVLEVRTLSDRVRRFGQQCRDMRRMMSGLELTRIMCKIERSKFDGDHAGLDEIVNRLAEAQTSLGRNFEEILNSVGNILSLSDEIQRSARAQDRTRPLPA